MAVPTLGEIASPPKYVLFGDDRSITVGTPSPYSTSGEERRLDLAIIRLPQGKLLLFGPLLKSQYGLHTALVPGNSASHFSFVNPFKSPLLHPKWHCNPVS